MIGPGEQSDEDPEQRADQAGPRPERGADKPILEWGADDWARWTRSGATGPAVAAAQPPATTGPTTAPAPPTDVPVGPPAAAGPPPAAAGSGGSEESSPAGPGPVEPVEAPTSPPDAAALRPSFPVASPSAARPHPLGASPATEVEEVERRGAASLPERPPAAPPMDPVRSSLDRPTQSWTRASGPLPSYDFTAPKSFTPDPAPAAWGRLMSALELVALSVGGGVVVAGLIAAAILVAAAAVRGAIG